MNANTLGIPQIQLMGAVTNPEFIPRKHTVESYRSQQRRAKKFRRNRKNWGGHAKPGK